MQINTEVFTTLPFTDREIISLFGNLLDNAIEACERITDKNTWIHIKMKKEKINCCISKSKILQKLLCNRFLESL